MILAGGLGSRLLPMTRVTNKHLLPVYDRPMIYHPIQQLVHAGIRDILVVTGGNDAGDFLRLLCNGREFGLEEVSYTYQDGEGGIAEVLGLTEHFADGEPIAVVLGDNIFQDPVAPAVRAYEAAGGRRGDAPGRRITRRPLDHGGHALPHQRARHPDHSGGRSGARVRRFLHCSTDEVYGELPWRDPAAPGAGERFTEDVPLRPRSPYSASKAGSDHLALAYHSTHGFDVVVTRCSNNYGPYQFPEKLIPLCVTNALECRSLPV